jgi:hypothetical protein
MLRPFRLLMLATLAFGAYVIFFAVPDRVRDDAAFNPAEVARYEVEAWKAADGNQEFAIYPSVALMLREQHRFSWFRAAQASYYLSRAIYEFTDMTNRFERVMPDLEGAAAVERAWKNLDFNTGAAARAQLNGWATSKAPNPGDPNEVAAIIAEDYSLRYGLPPGDFMAAAGYRGDASRLRYHTPVDPDWTAIERLLTESYRALQAALEQGRARRHTER